MNRSFDVAVVGGGPAGSFTAGYLAQKGISVALIEADRHPRYAVGESLLPHAWRFMDLLGVSEKIEREGFVHKSGVTALWDGILRQFEFSWFDHSRPALIVERDRFDEILFGHAAELGATSFEGVKVCGIEAVGERRRIVARTEAGEHLSLSTRFVVDASGRTGVLSWQPRAKGVLTSERGAVFLWGYFRKGGYLMAGGAVGRCWQDGDRPREATSYMCNVSNGWALHLPLRDRSFAGISLTDSGSMRSGSDDAEAIFLHSLATVPNFDHLLSAADYIDGSFRRMSDFSHCAKRFSGDGYVLVGDAAAYADPIFAHGVQFALFSAYAAANAISQALGRGRTTVAPHYDRQLRQHYDMSRAMAHGGCSGGSTAADLLRWMSQSERDLLCTSAAITGRQAHFSQLASAGGVSGIKRVRVLGDLHT